MSGLGNGGPDDNDAQAGRLVVADTMRSHPRPGSNSDGALVTFTARGRDGETAIETQDDGIHPALRSGRGGGRRDSGVTDGVIVRRLMPVECERLQGFPDGWTDLGDTPDTPRYSAMGDAVTVNVAEWIGGRL